MIEAMGGMGKDDGLPAVPDPLLMNHRDLECVPYPVWPQSPHP